MENFFPSILRKLFIDNFQYAKNIIDIDDEQLTICMLAQKNITFQ